MGAREKGENKGAIVEEPTEERISTLSKSARIRWKERVDKYASWVHADSKGRIIVKDHSRYLVRSSRICIIESFDACEVSKKAKHYIYELQPRSHDVVGGWVDGCSQRQLTPLPDETGLSIVAMVSAII